MPLPKKTKDRCKQILNWIMDVWPPPGPVILRFEKVKSEGPGADCAKVKKHFVIRLDPRLSWYSSVETLMHEYAHVLTWPLTYSYPDHSDEWALAFGRMYRKFHDENGYMDSREYDWK